MSELVLVHGGFHGAWCWDRLLPELRKFGHRCITMDLPVDRIGARVDTHADAVCDAMAGLAGGDAILIGHSLAGTVLPRVALRRKVGGLIYLCPAIPPRDEAEQAEDLAAFGPGLTDKFHVDKQGLVTMTEDDAIFVFYHDAPPDLARWAAARLRPQWAGSMSTTYAPLEVLPDIPTRAIICAEDRVLRLEETRRIIQRRLHTDPIEFPGGHSPFLSRPSELAVTLNRLIPELAQP